MALVQAQFVSESLMRSVPIEVILPVDKLAIPGAPRPSYRPFKTLYLLHGVFGSCVDWVHGTRVQRWAEERDLCVVMPSGENGFYVDNHAAYNHYGTFIAELVEVTRRMFRLSERREDTFIGGLSMGGYGALENGLRYHDTFGAICAFSPALLFEPGFGLENMPEEGIPGFGRRHLETCFGGDLDAAAKTGLNPRMLARELVSARDSGGAVSMPEIYISCGTADELILPHAQTFAAYLDEIGYAHTYEEWAGAHEWDFWDACIRRAMDWLPLDDGTAGINSGNVTGE